MESVEYSPSCGVTSGCARSWLQVGSCWHKELSTQSAVPSGCWWGNHYTSWLTQRCVCYIPRTPWWHRCCNSRCCAPGSSVYWETSLIHEHRRESTRDVGSCYTTRTSQRRLENNKSTFRDCGPQVAIWLIAWDKTSLRRGFPKSHTLRRGWRSKLLQTGCRFI